MGGCLCRCCACACVPVPARVCVCIAGCRQGSPNLCALPTTCPCPCAAAFGLPTAVLSAIYAALPPGESLMDQRFMLVGGVWVVARWGGWLHGERRAMCRLLACTAPSAPHSPPPLTSSPAKVGESPRLTAVAELLEEAVQREHGRGTVLEARRIIHMVDQDVRGGCAGACCAALGWCWLCVLGAWMRAWGMLCPLMGGDGWKEGSQGMSAPASHAAARTHATCHPRACAAGSGGARPRRRRVVGGSQAAVRAGAVEWGGTADALGTHACHCAVPAAALLHPSSPTPPRPPPTRTARRAIACWRRCNRSSPRC